MLATISDKKIQHDNGSGQVDYYSAGVVTANDYYPGGMQMPGRKYSSGNSSYRYSINGQEKEKELNENITSAEFWMYDSRLVRRWNVDPLQIKHPSEAPYLYTAANPILFMDPDGKDRYKYYVYIDEQTGKTVVSTIKLINKNDLKAVHNISYPHSGIVETWDWYDVNEVHYVIKHKDGSQTNKTVEEKGEWRANTSDGVILKGIGWANFVKKYKPSKEGTVPNGIVEYTSENSREGSEYNKKSLHIDAIVNIEVLMRAIETVKGAGDLTNEQSEGLVLSLAESVSHTTPGAVAWKEALDKAVEKIKEGRETVVFCNGGCGEKYRDSANAIVTTDKPATDTAANHSEMEKKLLSKKKKSNK